MDVANQPVLDKAGALSAREVGEQWLAALDRALQSKNRAALAGLFAPEGHYRDLLAFTWSITPCQGADEIAALLAEKQSVAGATAFAIAEGRTPPRRVARAGLDVIEGIIQFETKLGRGFGVVRLLAADTPKAFQLMTSLHELKGFEEKIGSRRPT